MGMEWKDYADKISELLGLEGNPVAITYSMKPPLKSSGKRHRVCDAFLNTRDGEIVDLTAQTCSCVGGTWHLGLVGPPTGGGL